MANHGRDEHLREQRGNLGAEWLREFGFKIFAHLAQREQHFALRRPDEEQREISSRGDASIDEFRSHRCSSSSEKISFAVSLSSCAACRTRCSNSRSAWE